MFFPRKKFPLDCQGKSYLFFLIRFLLIAVLVSSRLISASSTPVISKKDRVKISFTNPVKNLKDMYGTYSEGYAPPLWVIDFLRKNKYFEAFAKEVEVYMPKKEYQRVSNTDEEMLLILEALLAEREPCTLKYSINRWKNEGENGMTLTFPWKKAYYRRYFQENSNKKLAPNFAFYCRTPLVFSKNQDIYPENSPTVHLMNVTGYSFYKPEDEDYKYFVKGGHEKELKERYKLIFIMIFRCAIQHGFERIILAQFGLANFANKYPNKKYLKNNIWADALKEALHSGNIASELTKAGVEEISFMGKYNENGITEEDKKCYKEIFKELKIGTGNKSNGAPRFRTEFKNTIPGILQNKSQAYLDKTLYINAWDPYSMLGNGNGRDNSLDGQWGRLTAISALGWLWSNPKMLENFYIVNHDDSNPLSKKNFYKLSSSNEPDGDSTTDSSHPSILRNIGLGLMLLGLLGGVVTFVVYSMKSNPKKGREG